MLKKVKVQSRKLVIVGSFWIRDLASELSFEIQRFLYIIVKFLTIKILAKKLANNSLLKTN